jgi:competence protein ComEC
VDLEAAAVWDEGGWRRRDGRVRIWIRGLVGEWTYGDCFEATVALRRPRNFGNPGAFDYRGHLARQGIFVIGYVADGARVERCAAERVGVTSALDVVRRRIAVAIERAGSGTRAGVLRALVLGERGGIERTLESAFARAGLAHALSISGLHVAVVGGAVFATVRRMSAWNVGWLARGLAPRLGAAAALPVVWGYAALAGAPLPAVRAAMMATVYLVGVLMRRRASVLQSLALAALLMTISTPDVIVDASFQLSFIGVLALVLGARRLRGTAPDGTVVDHDLRSAGNDDAPPGGGWYRRARDWVWRWGRDAAITSFAAALGTAPLTALHFNQVSVIGPAVNLLGVPILSLCVVLAVLGAVLALMAPAAAALVFRGAGGLAELSIRVATGAAVLPWAAVRTITPSALEIGLAYVLMGALVIRRRRVAWILVTLAVLGAFADGMWWRWARSRPDSLRMAFLDVGQGDAAVVEFPDGQVLVVDGGGLAGSTLDVGEAVVARYLWFRRIGRVDFVAMSHADMDHAGGLAFLIEQFRPREFWWNGRAGRGAQFERLTAALASGAVRVRRFDRTTPPWRIGPVEVRVLHPDATRDAAGASDNDASLVLRLGWGETTALFSGDIELAAEREIAAHDTVALASAVLKVPHHGSRTSSGERFLDAVSPAVAVVSAGWRNRYGFPHREIQARFDAREICLRRTDEHGAIIVEGGPDGYAVWPRCPGGSRPDR